ncbi:MAG: hypothetical protein EPN98_06550 [Phenylobacterium sp.]|uniref:hypothetical protein n=1 Tax=Phenylobacterium sp. TaxID=1871053 RepID=UPI00121CE38C|nr:hypothetical protein [Phenylobacterium sp.]TAL35619.1 MAG: hypothetical protein EPN98_06550 [Phenylobacterium sp.]
MIAEQVRDFIVKHRPKAVCDDCIADGIPLKRRQQAHRCTMPFGLTSEFDRRRDRCSICGDDKLVIKKL